MKVVVIGDGKIGRTIVEQVCQEGHEVTVIDKNETAIEQIIELYDVMGICGNGASYDILKSADVGKADLVIAATDSDETNILSCLISKKLGAKSTIARVRSYEYMNQLDIIKKDLGVTMTINPEQEAANEITKIINFPEANRVDSFSKNVDLVELYIPEDSNLVGKSLASIYKEFKIRILVCTIQRNDEVIIPTGNFVFQAKDKVHITASKSDLKAFLIKAKLLENKINSVLIIGGGKLSVYLTNELLKNKYEVKIIEKNKNKCYELSELFPKATIIHGDGSDQKVLLEEGIQNYDAIVCATGIDEENMIISMYADKLNVQKVITKISKTSFKGLLESVNSSSIIAPQDIIASKIVSYIRGLCNARGNNVITLHKLINNKVEALEFKAKNDKKLINIPLKNLKLKENILIAAIIRNSHVIYPSGDDIIEEDDNVVIVTTNQFLDDLSDILE